MKSASAYFPSLDILRGFAALSVVVYHVIELFDWKAFPTQGGWLWFRIGWMGVDLFFVISGFVIGLSAFAEIERSGASGFRAPFLRRRLARIVPLHYLTCLVFAVFVVPEILFHPNLLPNLLTHALFLHNLFPAFQGAINGSNWSLGAEMQFYVLVLLIGPWLRRERWYVIFFTLLSVAWGWRFVSASVPVWHPEATSNAVFFLSTQLPGMLDEFGIGLLIARLVHSEWGARWLKQGAQRPWLSVLFAAVLFWLVLHLFWQHAGTYWQTPWVVTTFRTFLALAFAAIVLAACCLNSRWWIILSTPLRYLGDISYGIYLWHLPVIVTLKRFDWLGPERALPLVLALTLLLASLSWHFFERPLIARYGKSFPKAGAPRFAEPGQSSDQKGS